mmetsp:Transcript_27089/g.48583  ORF Transcript_27089/g.48583 Transcript_27089/m.48583 type:complete len:174 (+) Transcript_27089:34-555(+)
MLPSPTPSRKSFTPSLPSISRRSASRYLNEDERYIRKRLEDRNLLENFKQIRIAEAYRVARVKRDTKHEGLQALQDYKDKLARGSRKLKMLSLQYKIATEKKLFDLNTERARLIKIKKSSHRRIASDQLLIAKPDEEYSSPEGSLVKIKISIKHKARNEGSVSRTTQTDDEQD